MVRSRRHLNATLYQLVVRAIMFHIGVATQHPPLPDKSELSDIGIAFIQQCLTIDPLRRPTAQELMQHTWMTQFLETLQRYEDDEFNDPSLNEQHLHTYVR